MSEPLDPAGQLGPHPDSPGTGRPPGTHDAGDAGASATGAAAAASTTSGAATAPATEDQDSTGAGDQPSSLGSGGHAESDPDVTGRPRAARRRWSRTTLIFAGALTGLVVLALISAAIGQVPTSPAEVAGAFLHRFGLDWGPMPAHPAGYVTLWEVRFPRVVLGMLVGAALATAGALLQGVFANPLAEPGVIGVSAGAAVGAGAVIVAGGAFAAAWSVAAGAFVAGLGTTLLVYLLARSNGRTEVVTLVLTGVAINAFAGGLISFLLFSASPAARDQIVFWQMGSLNGATWQSVNVVWPLTLIGLAAAIWMAPRLDLLALGESAARHLGVDVERLRRNVIVVVAVLATAGVAFTGIILFVGLIVPHLVRMLVGPGHRVLIPLSAIVGAVVLVAADIGARALVHNADLPLGMITSLVGGPFFFWLLRRTRSRSGGWA
ncbi:FecCD family ABC transporter permease [Nocardia tengchongensis]|uniref:FecCD family ABC transporter permease n=2 Tax=Nocardia tengchongensis TaxID=2055889 RepID=UPI00361E3093